MTRHAQKDLAGWGNFPRQTCHVARPEKQRNVGAVLRERGHPTYIPRGLGRSYGDAALNENAGVILSTRLDRLIDFDESTGVLHAEGGVSFYDIVQAVLPRGWFLPVTPGTQYVTLGGAIAADVHGKNHHVDGSIGNFVDEFELFTGGGETIVCSRSQNADVFTATLGGMGLTGFIRTAKLRLKRVPSAYVNVEYRRAQNLDQALDLFAAGDAGHRYSVAWIDCLSSGESLGRSVLMRGDYAAAADLPANAKADPYRPRPGRRRGIPFNFPAVALNSLCVGAFNALYYHRHADSQRVVSYEPFFYPLDAIRNWNRMYGRRGFMQYQLVLPPGNARSGLVQILEKLAESRRASFLAVLKSFGQQGEGLLSFPRPGFTLALDLPNTGQDLIDFLHQLDEIVLHHGGRIYLAKDACLTPQAFAAMYPRLDEFKAIKRRVDPQNIFSSSMARRLGMVETA